MRLIDADALLDAISVHLERIEQEFDDAPTIDAVEVVRCKDCIAHKCCRFEQRLGENGYCSFFKDYGKAPWADGERHGRWIGDSIGFKCTCCGMHDETESIYCPNCGARMDGDAE